MAINIITAVDNRRVYEAEARVAPGDTARIFLPSTGPASLAVHAQGSTAKCSFYLSSVATIKAGFGRPIPAAVGEDGIVTFAVAATDLPSAVNAIDVTNLGAVDIFVEVLQ